MLPDYTLHRNFWSKVARTADVNACWEWTASKTGKGYGRIRWRGKTRRAHRVAFELTYGDIDDEIFVLHKCDNPPCCNPNHLFLGTQTVNIRDRDSKGRANYATNERHGMHKLTDVQVQRLREMYSEYRPSYSTLALLFHISIKQVWNIINHRNRKDQSDKTS